MNCHLCQNDQDHAHHMVFEMMFGQREPFEYVTCGRCGLLQIARVPDDLARHYGPEYSSFKKARDKSLSPFVAGLRARRTRHYLGQSDPLGAAIALVSRRPGYFDWLGPFGLTLESSIVDVGCGSGGLLLKLRREGFTDLTGVDPFLPAPLDHGNGVRIIAKPLDQVERTFDLIMLHHSLEHMPDQHAAMQAIRGRLNPGGGVLLRIPLSNSYPHRRYGVHWASWDAPRHLYLHTMRSIHLLAEKHGFEIFHLYCDSGAEGIIGSEYQQRDIPRKAWPEGDRGIHSPFTRPMRRAIDALVKQLNLVLDGDTAVFFLRDRK
ncbi:hypothetical protein SIID45300_02556 [Candidatus Magnetaquicoccaceae bacterium FCR-1]|uniref:Class I SAM-dependent methyltransferase n=1 Tax=Candidatus Magnetaquiglobus chichijimensis TaxID=3141448 RepID=A0ABQ0CBF3_9PROT